MTVNFDTSFLAGLSFFFFNCTLTLDVALLHTVKNLYNQNTKVKIGYLFFFFFFYRISYQCSLLYPDSNYSAPRHLLSVQTDAPVRLFIDREPRRSFIEIQHINHAWKAFLHLLQELFVLLIGEAPTFTLETMESTADIQMVFH